MSRVQIAQPVPGLLPGATVNGLPDVLDEQGRVVGRTVDAHAERDLLVMTVELDDGVLPDSVDGFSMGWRP